MTERERPTDGDPRFADEPGERTRWTEDPAEDSELDPESEPGRGASYERPDEETGCESES